MTYAIPEDAVEVQMSDLRRRLRDYLERVAYSEDEIVIVRAGKPMAAMISMEAYFALRQAISNIEDLADAASSRMARESDDYVKLDDFLKESGDGA